MNEVKGYMYISQLPVTMQEEIRKDLYTSLIAEIGNKQTKEEIAEHVQNGMDSKLSNLNDTIDIRKYLGTLPPTLDDGLLKVIDYLQSNDSNGTYDEMIEEYEHGDIELQTIKDALTDVLLNWMLNTLPDDTKQVKELQDMLGLIV